MLKPDVGVVAPVQARHHLAPEHAGLHHVGLLAGGHLAPPATGQLEGHARHPLDLRLGVELGVHGPPAAVGKGLDPPRLAEIDPAGELAHDQDVEPRHHLPLQTGGVRQGLEAQGRPKVGEGVHRLAQAQEPRLGPLVARDACPLGTADRPHQHGVRGQGLRFRLGAQGLAVQVEAGPTERLFGEFEMEVAVRGHPGGDPAHLGDHLGPDAVPGQEQESGHQAGPLEATW